MSPLKASTLRPFLVIALSLAVGFALLLAAPNARAQGKAEGPAKALQKKAMEEDYLATDFAAAQSKLEKAIAQCGTNNCSAQLRARLKRDLGVVLIGGGIDKDQGVASLAEAVKLDPSLTLDPDFKTKDLEAAFAEAKKRAASGGGEAGGETGGGAEQPEGDFTHTPTEVQQIRTPIPIYAEYNGEEELVRVKARYKGFGMTEWKTLDLSKIGDKGWGALIPCADVIQGTTQYYLQGFNSANDPVAIAGDRNNPYKVRVTREAVDEPPHLPGQPPPTQCADTGDCPPNFPGCKKAGAGAGGSFGETKSEPTGKDGGEFCEEDDECKSGKCVDAKCTEYEGEKKGPRVWAGISGGFDYAFVPSATDVCKVHPKDASDTNTVPTPINDANYYCTKSDGSDYPSRTNRAENDGIRLSNDPRGTSDTVNGGGAFGNVRVMLTLDYAVNSNVLIGGRLGLVLNSYPGKEAETDGKRFPLPIHLELRMTYLIGSGDPLYKKGLVPYVFGGAGIGQFETRVPVTTIEDPAGGTPSKRSVDAWHLAGPAFVTAGGGGRWLLSQKFALTFGLRGNLAFLNSFEPSIGPEIGGQIGF